MSIIDLHSHSTASDGALTPTQLVERAKERHLKVLALTDHDCVAGIAEATAAAGTDLQLVPGIEVSSTWRNFQIHVAGLFVQPDSEAMRKLVAEQRVKRIERAEQIGQKLEQLGFADAYERTKAQAGPGAVITRGNYARFIVSEGKATTTDEAFNTYLKKGKKAYVSTQWRSVPEAVQSILLSGGIPVLAHPRRYIMTNTKLRELMSEFKAAGGVAIEVCSAQQSPNDRLYLADLCERFDFLASVGSDFHQPGLWRELGKNLDLPERCLHRALWKSEQYAHLFRLQAADEAQEAQNTAAEATAASAQPQQQQ